MLKRILLLSLIIGMTSTVAIGADIGNKVNEKEYPSADKVLPANPPKADFVIEGSVEKNIDMTLDKCIELALGNNPQINAAFHDILASDARIKQVWANYFPQLSWQTGYTKIKQLQLSDALGRNLTFNYYILGQVTLQQMLYDFGVTQNQATIKRLDYEAYKTTLSATINDVIYQTKDAYFNLLFAFENRRVAEDTVKKFEMFYNQAKAFYEIGMNPKVDVTIAEVNLSNAKLMLIQADNAIDIAMAKLNNTMGLPYSNKYNINDGLRYLPCDISLNKAIEVAQESRPEFQLAEVKVEAARQNVKLVKKSYFPSLNIDGQYQIGGKSWDSNYGYNFGGYLNFPTINMMLIHSQIKEAKAIHSKEQANAANTINDIYLQIQQAYYTMIEKKNSIPVAFLGLKQAKENYELSYGRYKVGVGNPIELKEAQVQYQNAMLQYYNSLNLYNASRADLEQYIGRNLNEGEVQLQVDTKQKKKKSK